MASGGREGPRTPPGPPRAGPSRRPPTGIGLPHACGKHDGRASPIGKRNAPKGRGPRFSFLAFSAEAETIIPASRNPSNRHAGGLRPARSIGRNPLWPVTLRLTERPKKKKQGIAGQTIHDTGKDTIMSQYRITATITSQTQATDSGAWQMGITWRKSLTLDPAETQEAADLRNQAWEQAANGIDDETTRRIWQQVDTVTAREAERLRAQVRKLIGLLNAGRPALDENGYPMWDHLIALSNRQCWQWEIAAAHSGCLAAIMQAAGIDDWPPADSMPDITNPVITINLSTNQ